MEFITTDNTEIAAKINKVIKNELLSYTCQLFLISPYGKPEPEGSGVFVKLDESYYIFTASHVAKHLKTVADEKSPTLCVRGIHNNSYVTVLGSVVGTELKEKGEGVDLVDLAYIKLQEDFLGQINFKYKFLSIEKIRSHRKLVPASQYCVVGYPVKNEWVNDEGGLITKANIYLTEPSPEKVYDYYGYDKKTTILLDIKGKGKDLFDLSKKNKIDEKEFHGLSGGGLWFLIIHHNEEDEVMVDYKLIGIMTEKNKGKYFYMAANRVDILLYKLRETENYKFKEIPRYFNQAW